MKEEFRHYTNEVEVSSEGNVRVNGRPAVLHKDKYYKYIIVNGQSVRVHPMVGKCFPEICGEYNEGWHFHHINGDQLDNRAVNLRCVSPSEHKKHHQEEGGVSVPVVAYNLSGELVGMWDSKTQAADATGADYRHISGCISGERKTEKQMLWFVAGTSEEEIEEVLSPFINKAKRIAELEKNRNRDKIAQKDKDGNEIKRWKSVNDICDYYNINKSVIYANLNGKSEFVKSISPKSSFVRI